MTEKTDPSAEALALLDLDPDSFEAKAQVRLQRMLDAIPDEYKAAHEKLAFYLALKMEPPLTTFARYGYDLDGATRLLQNAAFLKLKTDIEADVQKRGLSFQLKARAMAEELLAHEYVMATDPTNSAAVRHAIITRIQDLGGYAPQKAVQEDEGKGGNSRSLNLNITFTGTPPTQVAAHQPITLDHSREE